MSVVERAHVLDADDGDRPFPPTVRSTDEDVIAFVAARTGAVGYVSADAVLPDTVHVVTVQ